ncbi:MAG: acyltransferase [Pseudomonadota bacterium]
MPIAKISEADLVGTEARRTSDARGAAASKRDLDLDVGRGIAILLVVYGHALIGAIGAGLDATVARFWVIMIYTSHMAFFFAVSAFLSAGMVGRNWPAFWRAAAQRILWPYLLWSLVLYSAHFVMSGYTNTALAEYQPWRILWKPPSVMWFLWYLLVALIASRVLRRAPRGLTATIGAAAFAAAYVWEGVPSEMRFVGLFLLVAAGGADLRRWIAQPWVIAVAGAVMAAMGYLAALQAQAPIVGYPAFAPVYIAAAFAGPVFLFALSAFIAGRFDGLNATLALSYIGQKTMAIFVMHILLTAGTRIALVAGGMTSWGGIVLLSFLAGVVVPLVFAWLAERMGIGAAMGWR